MGRPRKGWNLRDPRKPGDPYTVRFTDKEGRPRELTTGTSNPQQAAAVAAELYARDFTSGLAVRPRVDPLLALDELMASWLADIEKTHDRKTAATYTAYARAFVRHFGNSLAKVQRGRMADYQRERLTKVLRDTLNKERSAFNGFLDWCVEQGVLTEDSRPEWPKLPKKATGVRSGPQRAAPVDVTKEQVDAFLRALPLWSRPLRGRRHAVRARFVVAYETGLRPATLDELEIPTHWKPGLSEIRLPDEIDKARYGRKLPISELARGALEFVASELAIKSGLLFGRHDYRSHVEAARIAAGLPEDFAPYDLRHGRIGHLVDAPGAEVRAVMFLAGHRLMTTTNRYIRGQEGSARALLNGPSFGDISGKDGRWMLGAKEGSRTLTGVTPLEPESGVGDHKSNSYAHIRGQVGSQKDPFGQGFGDIPETQIPDSVGTAARYLALLRTTEEALEGALASELLEAGS